MIINDLFNNKKPGVEEAKKNRKKKSSRAMGGYFFPGYGYYGSGESGEGGGDGGGESTDRGMAEGSKKDRQWTNKDMERLRVATRDFDDIMASAGPDQDKHDLIKKQIQTKPMAGPKGVLPEQGVAEANNDTGVKWFDFATWVLKQGDKYKDFTTNHAVHQAAQKEYKAYVNSRKRGVAEVSLGDYGKKATMSRVMAQTNRFFDRNDPAAVAAADQTIAKRERGLARADARRQPYTPPAHDAEKHRRDLTARYPNIDELVADAEQRRDPDYNYAEGSAYYRGRESEQHYQRLKQIQRVIQGLNESLNRSHLP